MISQLSMPGMDGFELRMPLEGRAVIAADIDHSAAGRQ
jgi:hypothetical protein